MGNAKTKRTKIMCIIKANAVGGRLSEIYHMKYFWHEIFAIYGSWCTLWGGLFGEDTVWY